LGHQLGTLVPRPQNPWAVRGEQFLIYVWQLRDRFERSHLGMAQAQKTHEPRRVLQEAELLGVIEIHFEMATCGSKSVVPAATHYQTIILEHTVPSHNAPPIHPLIDLLAFPLPLA